MKNKTYDHLKFLAQIMLPALATCYVSIASLWNFGYIEQVSGTIMALDTFLGAILMISNHNYKKESETL